MKAIENWDNIQEITDIENLPAGGYIIQIRRAVERENKSGKGSHIEILFDVADGPNMGFFEKDYRAQTREDKYWRGVIRQNIPQEESAKYPQQCSFFKRFIRDIEESNPGYHWDWNEEGLAGKYCGCVFGEREKQSQRGTVYTITEATAITTTEAIKKGAFELPAKKRLSGAGVPGGTGAGYANFSDDDGELPF